MNKYDSYSPLALHDDSRLVRVPITFPLSHEGKIVVFVGDAHVRMFSHENLPDFIKLSIVQIKLIQGNTKFVDAGLRDVWMSNKTGIDSLDKVGWRVDDNFYIVIIDRENFMSLRGENDMDKLGLPTKRGQKLLGYTRLEDIQDALHRLRVMEDARKSLVKQYAAWSHNELLEEFHRHMRLEIFRRIDDENARRESESADKKAFERM